MNDLFPKPPKRMCQPKKDVLRDQLVLAADEIVRLRALRALLAGDGRQPSAIKPRRVPRLRHWKAR
ncbi:hypothetical protein ACFFGH_06420 [Lysobacter korlensis]|uniref:Transposase n=1 Tax=Lysobacter korlensis TaxID=553636 RepID=A0ABV6RNG7_9GAMM